jgi:hypothetical protein
MEAGRFIMKLPNLSNLAVGYEITDELSGKIYTVKQYTNTNNTAIKVWDAMLIPKVDNGVAEVTDLPQPSLDYYNRVIKHMPLGTLYYCDSYTKTPENNSDCYWLQMIDVNQGFDLSSAQTDLVATIDFEFNKLDNIKNVWKQHSLVNPDVPHNKDLNNFNAIESINSSLVFEVVSDFFNNDRIIMDSKIHVVSKDRTKYYFNSLFRTDSVTVKDSDFRSINQFTENADLLILDRTESFWNSFGPEGKLKIIGNDFVNLTELEPLLIIENTIHSDWNTVVAENILTITI